MLANIASFLLTMRKPCRQTTKNQRHPGSHTRLLTSPGGYTVLFQSIYMDGREADLPQPVHCKFDKCLNEKRSYYHTGQHNSERTNLVLQLPAFSQPMTEIVQLRTKFCCQLLEYWDKKEQRGCCALDVPDDVETCCRQL